MVRALKDSEIVAIGAKTILLEIVMRFTNIPYLTAALGAFLIAFPALAHHAFEAEFDQNKRITVTGVLTKLDWANPHVNVYLDAKDGKGQIVHWQFNSVPPVLMRKGGLDRSLLVIGQTFTIDGYGAKDGSTALGWIRTLHFPDGRAVDILRAGSDEPGK
jgi:hypothetical protein